MMRKIVLLAAYLPFAVLAAPAAADDRQDCASKKSHRKLEACTAIIQGGGEAVPNLAVAYRNRGVAHAARSDYDQAIADFNKAIELNPNYATAYNDRAVAYTNKGDFQRAVADVTKAVEIAATSVVKPTAAAASPASAVSVKKTTPGQPAARAAPMIGPFKTSVTAASESNGSAALAAARGNAQRGAQGPSHGGQSAGYGGSSGYGGSGGHGGHGDGGTSSGSSSASAAGTGSGSSGSGSSGSGSGGGGGGGGGSGSGGR